MAPRKITMLVQLVVLLALVLLDVRDLWFKWDWLGSEDSYRFTSTSVHQLHATADSPWRLNASQAANATTSDTPGIQQRSSGWSSFLQPCRALDGFHSKYFLHVRLSDCAIGGNSDTSMVVVPQIIASSGVRVDSMAWAACQLLFVHRRPPICHESIVVDFLRRHAMLAPSKIPLSAMVAPMSDGEAEALHLLDVISKSAPLSAVVCLEGFAYGTAAATTKSTLFACGSPTTTEAAFIGHHATYFVTLHRPLAWLTTHDINFLGMHYVVRQNAISSFSILNDARANNETMTLVHESKVNLSSSGVLWHLLLCVDLAVLLAHILSAVELATLVMRSHHKNLMQLKGGGAEDGELSLGFFAVSLYRSTPVLVLTLVSQFVSWVLILPTSVIWSWSDSTSSHVHAILTLLRTWVLVLLLVRTLWHGVVLAAGEATAYAVLKQTYVAPWELVVTTAFALLVLRAPLQTIREKKYAIDKQRLVDTTTFGGGRLSVVSNAYHDEQDYFPISSSSSVVALLYTPLLYVLSLSLVLVILLVAGRFVYEQRRLKSLAIESSRAASPSIASGGAYARLPAEDLLDAPIRAEQLVRSWGSAANCQALRVEQYLEYGVLLEDDKFLRTRQGFLGVVKPKIHMDDDHAVVGGHGSLDGGGSGPAQSGGDDGETHAPDSPAKKRRMSSHIPSLR